MKEIILSILTFFIIVSNSNAQSISVSASKSFLGFNIKTGYSIEKNKLAYEGGVKYLINRIDYFNPVPSVWKNQYYAGSIAEHFGLYGCLKRSVYSFNESTNFYVMISSDLSYLGNKGYYYIPSSLKDTFGDLLYFRLDHSAEATFVLETGVGIGIRSKLGNKTTIFLEGGVGAMLLFLPNRYATSVNGLITHEINPNVGKDPNFFGRIGILYPIHRKKE